MLIVLSVPHNILQSWDEAIGSVRAWSTGIATATKAEKTRDRPGRYENELARGRKMFAPFVLALTPSNRRYVRSLVRQEEIFKCKREREGEGAVLRNELRKHASLEVTGRQVDSS